MAADDTADAHSPAPADVADRATAVVTADAVVTTADAPQLTQPDTASRDQQTPELQAAELIALVDGGAPVREAALQVRMRLRTAYRVLAQSEDQAETMRGVVHKLMVNQTLARVRDWEIASEVGAIKRGNHAPARDWLLHAGVIDPLATDTGVNVRVAICIGTPEQPMHVTSPQVVDAERVGE